jgi:hypothetical protein
MKTKGGLRNFFSGDEEGRKKPSMDLILSEQSHAERLRAAKLP